MRSQTTIVSTYAWRMFLTLSLFLLNFALRAQQPSVTLSSPHGGGTVTACEQIVLTPGFSFTAGAGSSLLLQLDPAGCQAPPPAVSYSDQNYILEATPYVATQVVDVTTTRGKHLSIRYYDGLGRPLQEVAVGSTPAGGDLVRPIAYDPLGREATTYLPYERTGTPGSYTPHATAISNQQTFYNTMYGAADAPYAFSQKRFEASPLSRVLEEAAPGNDWRMDGGHTATFHPTTNADQQVARWVVANGKPEQQGYYAVGQLSISEVTDPDGITQREVKDKQGRVVETATLSPDGELLTTSYVYDLLDRLRCVIPPKAQGLEVGSSEFNSLTYSYTYDHRGRTIEKKLPDADIIYMVYDSRDRLVLLQDGNLRTAGRWRVFGYDALNRPAFEALLSTTQSHGELRTLFQAHAACQTRSDDGYTRQLPDGLPALAEESVLSYTFYDSYDGWLPDRLAFAAGDFPFAYSGYLPTPYGLATGSRVRVLDGSGTEDGWLTTATYYDDRYRPLQVRSDLYGGGTATYSTRYAFDGLVEQAREVQTLGDVTTTINTRTDYDHARRPVASYHAAGGQEKEVRLAEVTYDALGRTRLKTLGNGEQVSYAYNLRGWLTEVGSSAFRTRLYYQALPPELGGQPRWNGNIAAADYTRGTATHTYRYAYDGFNRLTEGLHSGGFSEQGITYDSNGNLTALTRKGGANGNTYAYAYSGNRLTTLTDATDVHTYAYDANGNTTTDGLRGMDITYNHLNLPQKVSKGDDRLTYAYNAAGAKLAKHYNGQLTQLYAGSIVYKGDGTLDYLLHPEGMARNVNGKLEYQYNLTDHLGSVRAVLNEKGGVEQVTDYYPFGLAHATENLDKNKYLYSAKELQDEVLGGTQYGILDYHARGYDQVTGRFTTRDPLTEKFFSTSSYAYCLNNPINVVDPDGRNPFMFLKLIELYCDLKSWASDQQAAATRLATGQSGEINAPQEVEIDDLTRSMSKISGTLSDATTVGQGVVDVAKAVGSLPVLDNVFDPILATASAANGNWEEAGMYAAGVFLPFASGAAVKGAAKEGKNLFKFTKTTTDHMNEAGRMIPIQTLDEIVKAPMAIAKDPQGATNAMMHYSQMWKNGKLYNVEVLYDKTTNTIMHFKYDTRALGPLPKIK